MSDQNKWFATGRLTRDPELTYTPKGVAVCNFSLAVGRQWYGEDGQKREEVSFVNMVAFGKTGENVGQYFKKGSFMIVEAHLKQESWEDRQTGAKRSALKMILDNFTFAPKGNEESRTDQSQQHHPTARSTRAAPARDLSPDPGYQPDPDEDEIPF